MKVASAISGALLASVAAASIYTVELLPAPFNSVFFGGGAGLLAATVLAGRVGRITSPPIGMVGVLPGVPSDRRRRAAVTSGKPLDKARLFRMFDREFAQLASCYAPAARTEILERLKPILYGLSPELRAWSGDVRIRAYLLMKEIEPDLSEPTSAKASLDLLVLILSKGGASALEVARPLFRQKIAEMYGKPAFDNEPFVPRLLLMLDAYDQSKVENVMQEAIHEWPHGQFRAASGYLGFEELAQRGMRETVRGLMRAEIARAWNDRDSVAGARAIELYHHAQEAPMALGRHAHDAPLELAPLAI